MPRSYRHISDYTEEIIRLKERGFTVREICEKFGFTEKQYKNFITRYNRKQEKIAEGIAIKKEGPRRRIIKYAKKIGLRSFATSSTEKMPRSNRWKWGMN